jgi:origin recognition complex subunit 1
MSSFEPITLRRHSVVLMDELDQLLTAKQDVVYNFFNWPTLRDSQLFVIAVANRMDLPQQLAAKVKSRLGMFSDDVLRRPRSLIVTAHDPGMQSLYFQPYDREALMAIAQSRLIAHPEDSRDPQVLHPEAIRLAAMKMAGTNGDARRVLDACR